MGIVRYAGWQRLTSYLIPHSPSTLRGQTGAHDDSACSAVEYSSKSLTPAVPGSRGL